MMFDFLSALYEGASGWLTLWTKQDRKTYWFPVEHMTAAAGTAEKLANDKDVYFGVGLRQESGSENDRGKNENVYCIPGFWVDMDIFGPAHKETALPPDMASAVMLLMSFPLKPSLLVDSGNGLHGYWLFKEPWQFDTPEERKQAADLSERFQGAIRQLAAAKHWKMDATHDLARVLRLPGTTNHKTEPKPVKILSQKEHRYDPSEFEQYLPALGLGNATVPSTVSINGQKMQVEAGSASLVLEHCAFVQHCKLDAAHLPEPEWYAMVTNVARAEGGAELVHELSKPYKGYSPKETDEKIQHALEEGQPHTCQYIQTTLGFRCPSGGCGVTAPCGFALAKLPRARAVAKKIVPDNAFDQESIGALAVLKKEEPAEYAKIKAALKGHVNLNDLERAIKKRQADMQQLRVLQADEEPKSLSEILPDIPLQLKIPYSWSFNENGIWMTRRFKDGNVETICACPVPVILTKRLRNIDTGEEKVELQYYRDGRWHSIQAARSSVFNRQGLIQLGDKGLPVSSETARWLVAFLDALERENLTSIPLVRSIGHMGWVGGKQFLPGLAGDIELDVDEGSGAAAVASGYKESGTIADWVRLMLPIRQYPLARFVMAASFATPLLKIVGQRVMLIHNWGSTRGGKTAALKAALSVWGDPEDLMASFNATKVGLERLASFYSDLPLGIDERQVVGDRQGFVESLVYLLGLGKGKVRGSKGGSLQQFNVWRTIALTTGEEPLSTWSSTGGIKTRTLELYGAAIPDEELAKNYHESTRDCHGVAGPEFMRQLVSSNFDEIKADYDAVRKALGENNRDHISSHLATVAMVALGDYYASKWIFGLDDETAGAQANALAQVIVGMLETAADIDDGERAYEYLMSWFNINENAFGATAIQRYGKNEPNRILIYPPIFDKAMKEGGFSPDRVLRDWADRGLIETDTATSKGKVRYKVRQWDPYKQVKSYYVSVLKETTTGSQSDE